MTTEDPANLDHHDRGAAGHDRIVMVHGFTQTSACWSPFDDALAVHHRLRLVDAPGHGRSGHRAAGMAEAARLLGVAGEQATYLGYSMGGRIALRLALDTPELVTGLVLIGASPGLADPDERAARRLRDDALAERLENVGLVAFVDEWLAQPLFAGLTAETAHRSERLGNTVASLAASLRALGPGTQEPLWERLCELTMPVLLVVGSLDQKFTAIAEQMQSRIGTNAEVARIDHAGHTAHLEQPARTADVVGAWLRRTR